MPSKPSATPSLPSDPKQSGVTSWTIPQPADVLSYAYLWAREDAVGQVEGLKNRPVVVVVAVETAAIGSPELYVVPITHTAPDESDNAVELPAKVKRYLGLDSERSWVIVSELNRFIWPGPDVQPIKGSSTPLYGALPDWLFERIKAAILKSNAPVVKRTE
jgi:hypothetical protein